VNHIHVTIKRLFVYICGLFFLAFGVSFSIQADLGVSPVSSLAYAFTLTTGFSVGLMTIVANILFIIVQVILSKRFSLRGSIVQLMISFVFGFFIDMTLLLLQLFPTPNTFLMQWVFLIISLFLMSIGLFGCFSSKYTLMPYDELTHVISETFNINLGKAKIYGDLINVVSAGVICIVFIQSLGSVGIGTIIAAYFIGKILGWLMKMYQKPLINWMSKTKDGTSKVKEIMIRDEQTSS